MVGKIIICNLGTVSRSRIRSVIGPGTAGDRQMKVWTSRTGSGGFLRCLLLLSLASGISACRQSLPVEVEQAYHSHRHRNIDFNRDIRPILSDRCFPCHGPDQGKLEAGLRLDLQEIAKGPLPEHPDQRAIVAGRPFASEVVHRILSADPESVMPPADSKLRLSPEEKAILIAWIEQGAEYKKHWAFIKPEAVEVPDDHHPVDYFIAEKLKEQRMDFSDEASRETILRRLTLDLTGLPPSLEEMDNFLSDRSPDAYEKQVDRLLASPHYGERMAADWLDVARYADTHGYTVDRYRDVSPWRDWVIRSLNANMPYDQFVTLQLAGDLLPGAGKDGLLATAFLRLHPQNMEGGIIPEEFRVEYVADRTNTFGTAFMGMTLSCAKCHDHKFDPISQKEYYRLFSFFNNLNEAGQISWNDAMPVPTMLLTEEREDSLIQWLESKIDTVEAAKISREDNTRQQAENWLTQKGYARLSMDEVNDGLVGDYRLDGRLTNAVNPGIKGKMDRTNSNDEEPHFTRGFAGQGLLLDGDAWLDLGGVGAFDRYQPFSVGLQIKLPDDLRDGVIFHKGIGAVLYNFRGFHLALKDNRLEILMAHTAPDNAILKYVDRDIPRNEWIHLMMTHDGSGKASGLQVYLNGRLLPSRTENDHLYKSLLFDFDGQPEPGIQIGARWRGKGTGGAVVDNVLVYDRRLTALEALFVADPGESNKLLSKEPETLAVGERELFREYFVANDQGVKELSQVLLQLRKDLCHTTDTIGELMIYREMPQPRPAYVLDRGQYDAYKERVHPATPTAILAMDTTAYQPNRLDLAKWLFHPDHPLTARVMVNRIWQLVFGRGLVRTAEDFGNQGTAPSHPELLDYLAVHFQQNGWDIKGLIRLLVTSRTYRQRSGCTEEERRSDPENIYLSRGPSRRVSAEMIRDQALAASRLLNRRIGGPSVYPYQPEGLWKINGAAYVESTGDDLYRRSLYTVWKRSVPHPVQSTFDAPERSECIMRRQQTNTPLQALVLMNDPLFVEAAGEIGRQIHQSAELIPYYRQLTGRNPSNEEVQILQALYEETLSAFRQDPAKAGGWFSSREPDLATPEAGAWAVVASTIINSDGFITKR
jgi:hypothetical protein